MVRALPIQSTGLLWNGLRKAVRAAALLLRVLLSASHMPNCCRHVAAGRGGGGDAPHRRHAGTRGRQAWGEVGSHVCCWIYAAHVRCSLLTVEVQAAPAQGAAAVHCRSATLACN